MADQHDECRLHLMSDVASTRATHQASIDAIWESWGDLTRFHLSTRIALQRELDVWRSIQVHSTNPIEISLPPSAAARTYEVKLDEHLEAIGSPAILASLVLVQSWSLAESLARIAVGREVLGTLEDWVADMLGRNQRAVADLSGGLGSLVESYVVRNSIAHGLPVWSAAMAKRVAKVGGPAHTTGETFDLSDEELYKCRASVRSLMNLSGLKHSATPPPREPVPG
jgi:hypothetical protein